MSSKAVALLLSDLGQFCRHFITWYNQERRHTGIGLLTPEMLHNGQAAAVWINKPERK